MLEQFTDAMAMDLAEELADINPYNEADVDENSFIKEARIIVGEFLKLEKKNKYTAADVIQPTFKVMRGRALEPEACEDAVTELLDTYECVKDSLPFYEDAELSRSLIADGNITPVMRVAEHFIVDSFCIGKKCFVYINERLFDIVNVKKAIDLYKRLLNDGDTVYVQYRRQLGNGLDGSYTKVYKKEKYKYEKLKRKENIVAIFDKTSKYDVK